MARKTKRQLAALKAAEQRRRAKRTAERSRRSKAAKLGLQRRAVRKAARRVREDELDIDELDDFDSVRDLDDYAEALGVDPEDLAEELGLVDNDEFWDSVTEDDYEDIAELLDVDISDVYDMANGYVPGAS